MATRKKKETVKKGEPVVLPKDTELVTVNPHDGDPTTMGWKMAKVLGEIHKIPKEGYNPHFEYRYVREDTLTEQIRPLLAKWGLSLVFGAEKVEDLATGDDRGTWTRVWCRFTLFDCDGHEFSVLCPGEGTDAKHPDKALYKAMTGSTKYFLYKTFLVSTGDDPERDDDPDSTPPPRGKKKQEQTKTKTQDSDAPDMMTSDQREELEKLEKGKNNFTEQLVKILKEILERGGSEGSARRIIAECHNQNKELEKQTNGEEDSAHTDEELTEEDIPF